MQDQQQALFRSSRTDDGWTIICSEAAFNYESPGIFQTEQAAVVEVARLEILYCRATPVSSGHFKRTNARGKPLQNEITWLNPTLSLRGSSKVVGAPPSARQPPQPATAGQQVSPVRTSSKRQLERHGSKI